MKCPRCEIGEISKIVLKRNEFIGFLCEYCGSVWFQDENIRPDTGHSIYTCGSADDREYTFVDIPQMAEDAKLVEYPKYK